MDKLYEDYSKMIFRYLLCLTRNEDLSEELTQETFYIAYKNINKFRGESKLSTWLCQIAKHLLYKEINKRKKENLISIEDIYENNLFGHDDETERIEKIDLYNKINSLDERTKEIIYLKIIGEFTFKEIGEMLNISENSARVIFYRGKEKIKGVNRDGK